LDQRNRRHNCDYAKPKWGYGWYILHKNKKRLLYIRRLGCTGTSTHDLRPANMPTVQHSESPTCGSQNNGVLTVMIEPLANGNTPTYDISFDNGESFYGIAVTDPLDLTGLPPGQICATFTSTDGDCEFSACYDIPGIPTPIIQITGQVTHNCPFVNNGKIDVTVTGTSNYSIRWNDNVFPPTLNRVGLGAGAYCLTITDIICGVTAISCFNVIPVSLSVGVSPSCENIGSASATALGGNQPLVYKWNNTKTTNNIAGLSSGIYCVTVTDSKGCIKNGCDTLQNSGPVIKSIEHPCKDVNFSGSITLEIHQPAGSSTPVVVDGVSLPAQSTSSVYEMTINNQSQGTHTISMAFSDCEVTLVSAPLIEKSGDLRYDHYDAATNLCVYDVYCKDSLLVDQGMSYYPTLLGNDAQEFPCKTPRRCGNTPIAALNGHKKKVRGYEYLKVLEYAIGVGAFSYDYMNSLYTKYLHSGISSCDFVKYCTASLEMTQKAFYNNYFGNGDITPVGSDGCNILHCLSLTGNTAQIICPSNVVPDYIQDLSELAPSCNPRIHNITQLIIWQDTMRLLYPTYERTELDIKITEYAAIYNDTTLSDDERNWTNCSYAIYCSSDFKVLRLDEQPIPSCNPPNPPNLPSPFCEINDNNQVICPDASGQPYPLPIHPQFSKKLYEYIGVPDHRVITPAFPGNDSFYRLGVIKSDGRTSPKGLIDQNGERRFLDYGIRNQWATREQIPQLVQYLDDWDDNIFIYIEQLHPNQYLITIDQDSITQSKSITAVNWLDIKNLTKTRMGVELSGIFSGTMHYNDVEIASSSDTAAFLIRLNLDGSLQSKQIIQNIRTNRGLDFYATTNGTVIIGTSKSNYVSVGSSQLTGLNDGGIFTVRLDSNAVVVGQQHGIRTTGNMRLLRTIASPDGSTLTYLIKGSGVIGHGSQDIVSSLAVSTWLVTTTNTGILKWTLPLQNANFEENELDLTYGDSLGLYIGLAFRDSVSLGGHTWQSQGGKDIFLAKIGADGSLLGGRTYGSSDDEVIKKIFFSDKYLFLTGDYFGITTNRTIGRNQFTNLGTVSQNLQKAYMTFVTDTDLLYSNDSLQNQQSWISKTLASYSLINNSQIQVFPNPVKDQLTVRIQRADLGNYTVRVFDVLGNLMIIKKATILGLGSQEVTLNQFSRFPIGMYIVQITDEQGHSNSVRVLRE